ncbi:uncharacterized protein LOC119835734 [Zerene cesonia]|uniref:uncharacterized protein LOC119835734 n=1 Tax=Zerene cesonia TaxID=33412 RepID=UPI0018E58972|nr:uncharacterized protein LOC119835734 [Zerene cesonia]
MNCFSVTFFLVLIIDIVSLLETTKEQPKETSSVTASYKISHNDYHPTPDTWDTKQDKMMKSLWVYRPPSLQTQLLEDHDVEQVAYKAPHLLTKLAKPFEFGADPYFSKGYFEPFERRHRPVTLVAFRKNGYMPRRSVIKRESSEIAELQSPYNEIGRLWQEEPSVYST